MICVSIGRTRHNMMYREHQALAEEGIELVELRLDWLSKQPDLTRLLKDRPTPTIVTCRRREDRGRWRWSEDQRQSLLRAAIVAGVDYIDLEDDIAGEVPRYGDTKRIVSHHNFDETPEDLADIYERMLSLDPDLIKIATMAHSPTDMVRVLKLVALAEVPTVGFCMGELGTPSRILCGKYGSPFTYASFSAERELAPGQISYDVMRDQYRFDEIDSGTKVFGVLGDPIVQSLSPLLHNAVYKQEGMNHVYLPFRVPMGTLQESLNSFIWLDIQGYSVTIPHKREVALLADVQDDSMKEVGAANTLCLDHEGHWVAFNTDYKAIRACVKLGLEKRLSGNKNISGKKVLILGAGGVARAAAFAMKDEGASVIVANRNQSRAVDLARELGCKNIRWEHRSSEFADILINCTPVGMFPESIDETPFPSNAYRERMLVLDTVYNPENTLLLKQARDRGCETVSGLEMFVRQAAEQFQYFTGMHTSLDAMRDALRRGISVVKY